MKNSNDLFKEILEMNDTISIITIDRNINHSIHDYKIDNGDGTFSFKEKVIDERIGKELIEVTKDVALKNESFRIIYESILTLTPDRYFIVKDENV